MANHPPGQGPGDRPMPEPPVRRWSHPVEGASVPRQAAPTLHYICCALSYQNQTLADSKALLQQILENQAPS